MTLDFHYALLSVPNTTPEEHLQQKGGVHEDVEKGCYRSQPVVQPITNSQATDHKFTSKHGGGIISVESVSDEATECSVVSMRVARHGEQQQRVNGEHGEVA